MSFKVGQDVLYVGFSNCSGYRKNTAYTIRRLYVGKCGCFTAVDVGISVQGNMRCAKCGHQWYGPVHLATSAFRPLDEVLNEINIEEIKEVLETVTV